MKVVHVISGLNAGGAEHFVFELCKYALSRNDADMSVLSLSAASTINEHFNKAGIRLLNAHPSSSRKTKAASAFSTLIKAKAHVIHAHMFHACFIACCVKLFRPKTKIVFTLHNNFVSQWHRRIILYFTRFLRSADIVFPGLAVKWYQKKKSVVIPNGINIDRFLHLNTDKPPLFTCCYIGRLSDEKNPLFLIDLAKALVADHNFLIRVAGEGPLKEDLIESIQEEKLSEHFTVEGYVEDVAALLAESHCLLLPSLWEGMPLVVLEAGAAGVPIIATPIGNITSLLNESNGFVRELDNFPQAVEQVMNNYGDALIKARAFMHTVHKEYNLANCYERHLHVYRQK